MDEIEFREHSSVVLIRSMADDEMIADDARLSTKRHYVGDEREAHRKAYAGLVRSLMRERHGTPFEAPEFVFEIEAPIFVARESHRHRVASISEMSGRYIELPGVFWVPPRERPLVQTPGTKQMAYSLSPGTDEQYASARRSIEEASEHAWVEYQRMLEDGVLKEVARVVLPVNVFTRWRLRINLRSALNFISLRVRVREDELPALFPSKPQLEIDEVARQMESIMAEHCPVAVQAFVEGGRVAP